MDQDLSGTINGYTLIGGGANMTSEAQKRASAKYDNANTVQIKLKLNLKTDADIIEKLNSITPDQGGKQGYIKALIRRDMNR